MSVLRALRQRQNGVLLHRYRQWMLSHSPGSPYPAEVAARIAEVLTSPVSVRVSRWSPSSAHLCQRRQVLTFTGAEHLDEPNVQRFAIFDDGHWRHRRHQANLLTAGLVSRIEVPYSDASLRLSGTVDAVNDIEGWGLEIKGTSLSQDRLPVQAHIQQVTCYALMSGLRRWVILYDHKINHDLTECVVDVDDPMLDGERARLASLNLSVDTGEMPPVLPECEAKQEAWQYCPYRLHCT